MEHFIVSARKYRPQTFEDVVGQQSITNTLLNAIDNDHLAQALLFCGPRGVGKTSCARILAKKINQLESENPEEDFAFNIFELDAASNNKVDDIRNLIEQVRIPPQIGTYKVYIIDEVHMLSSGAFNAFLKTLEEPPKHAIFILATTEKHKIIPTILSRCQIFDFKRITVTDAKLHLAKIAEKEGVIAEDDALHIIAQKADGAMRDALSIYDRVVSFCGKNLTRKSVSETLNVLDYDSYFTATDHLIKNDIPNSLLLLNDCISRGFDAQHFIAGLASHFRDLMVCKNESTLNLLEVGDETKVRYKEQSKIASLSFLQQAIEFANECDYQYKTSNNQRLSVEICLMKIASINFDAEKKKSKNFIIPASYFITSVNPEKIKEVVKQVEEKRPKLKVEEPKSDDYQKNINISSSSSSGLSINSLRERKELLRQRKEENEKKFGIIKTEDFTEERFLEIWNAYIIKLDNNNDKLLSSILKLCKQKVNGLVIEIEVPNVSMKQKLEEGGTSFLMHLRKELQNDKIYFNITVNKEVEQKKSVYTTKEKYEYLVEQNPLLEEFRKNFDLEL